MLEEQREQSPDSRSIYLPFVCTNTIIVDRLSSMFKVYVTNVLIIHFKSEHMKVHLGYSYFGHLGCILFVCVTCEVQGVLTI